MNRIVKLLLAPTLAALCLVACAQSGPRQPGDPDGPGEPPPGDPDALHDVIAYVTADGDAIRLIGPDGANDRQLWAHDQPDPESVYAAWSLAWNPGSTRLAFVSTHENWCSLLNSDVYVIGADGTGYARVTQAPACAELSGFPQASVTVPVTNPSFDSFSGFLYFQGAESIQPVNLPPSGTGVVTFPRVADLASGAGDEALQVGAVIVGGDREILFATAVDVPSSGSVTTGETAVYHPAAFWEARSPSWHADGETISFLYNFGSFFELPWDPEPLAFGAQLTAEGADMPGFIDHLARGPTPATAEQIVYYGGGAFEDHAIYLAEEGATDAGTLLVPVEEFQHVKGIAWLPDASGFVFSVTEGDMFGPDYSANMYLYELAGGATTPLTTYVGSFVGDLSVSGDGTHVAFELGTALDDLTQALVDPDLYVLDLASGQAELLVEGASSPAWSW